MKKQRTPGRYVVRVRSDILLEQVSDTMWEASAPNLPPLLSEHGVDALEFCGIDAELIEAQLRRQIVKKCLRVTLAFLPASQPA